MGNKGWEIDVMDVHDWTGIVVASGEISMKPLLTTNDDSLDRGKQ